MPERDAVADAPPLPPPGDAGIALCMSVRNHAHMVDRALEGIARQERPFDQVLLIDDGSTDATHDHLCRFAAGRPQVQVFRNPESVGVVAAIMRVLDRVDTGYLVCAAADDLLLPAAAARLSDAAAAWPQAAVVMGEILAQEYSWLVAGKSSECTNHLGFSGVKTVKLRRAS